MKYDSLKRLDRRESSFLLGGKYIMIAARTLKVDEKRLIAELMGHINNGGNDSDLMNAGLNTRRMSDELCGFNVLCKKENIHFGATVIQSAAAVEYPVCNL
jgi:hypothetical protein